jgi:enoyl-CoA hydratase/carnithine racemase
LEEQMAAKTVKTEQSGRVLTVRLHNPPHNFMTGGMVIELDELTRGLEGDESIGAVVITGDHPEAFITHYDVAEILAGAEQFGRPMPAGLAGGALRTTGALSHIPGAKGALRRSPAAGLVELRRFHDLFARMNSMDKVFIAAINGVATGGGCELALGCDVRIISEDGGPIGLPEMTVGFNPGGGGTQRMTRLLGAGRALEMMLEARTLEPAAAVEVGLVHRAVPAAELMAEATATAERLARRAPASVAALKRVVYEGGSRPLPEGLHLERAAFLSNAARPPAQRAMRAYVEELEQRGGPPFADREAFARWQEGTAVDLTG